MKKNIVRNKCNSEGENGKSNELSPKRSEVVTIPVDIGPDLPLCFPIEIQLQNSSIISKKTLLPALFQIVSHADKPESVPALKRALAMSRLSLSEMTLDAERLEEVLNAMAKKKSPERRMVNPSKNFVY